MPPERPVFKLKFFQKEKKIVHYKESNFQTNSLCKQIGTYWQKLCNKSFYISKHF